MKSISVETKGILFVLAAAFLWSIVGTCGKFCLNAGMTPLFAACVRSLCASSAFMAHLILIGKFRIPWRHALVFMLFGVWGIACFWVSIQYTVLLVGVAMDVVLQYTAPFWVAIFARIIFGDRISYRVLFAIVLASIGTICVCFSGSSTSGTIHPLGIATGLFSGFCYATYFPFMRYWQNRGYTSAQIFVWMMVSASLVLCAICAFSPDSHAISFPPSVWIISIGSGFACTYLGYLCYGKAVRRINMVKVSIILELDPVLAVCWASFFYNESFSAIGWIGSLCIIFSLTFLAISSRR